jgi:hypothetical protein
MGKSFKEMGRFNDDSDDNGPESRRRQRKTRELLKAKDSKEDFLCGNCGLLVPGNAPGTEYRNHCPTCMFSKHVDSSPGDRAASGACGSKMEPIKTRVTTSDVQVLHHCTGCSHEKWNRIAADDNVATILSIPTDTPEAVRIAVLGKRASEKQSWE